MPNYDTNRILFGADIAGTMVFTMEGASAGINNSLDLLGLIVLAFAMALDGGMIRDLLIGAVPPAALRDWRYAATAFAGGTLVFFLHQMVITIPMNVTMVLDAAGLAFFAIAGTEKALLYKCIRSSRCCSAPSPGWAKGPYGTCSWRGCRGCCRRMCMRRRHWRGRCR